MIQKAENDKSLFINNDKPKNSPTEDLLGYDKFAKFVADNIIAQKTQQGLVVSINAPWGYGKTTCLKFIEYYLLGHSDISILHFNPWGVSENKNDLILKFLHTLGKHLGDIVDKNKKQIQAAQRLAINEKAGNCIWHFLKYQTRYNPKFNTLWKGLLGYFSATAVEQIEKLEQDIHIQKQKIEKILEQARVHLVVFIDDIDRLSKEEIRDTFRLIKAIADFNFITYVVAFDQNIVVDALNKDFCKNGFDYVKKIVQLPLNLPKIDYDDIENLLYEKLNTLTKSIGYDLTYDARERWFTYHKSLIQPHIKSVRDVNRLFNGLLCNYAQVSDDVDLVDFLALEIIRLFRPELYQEISEHLHFYAGQETLIFKHEKERYFNHLADNFKDDLDLIKTMFPQAEQFFGGTTYGGDWQSKWNKEKRICANEKVDIYFGLRLKPGQVSDMEATKFLSTLNSQKALDDAILSWAKEITPNGRSKLFFWIPKLTHFSQSIVEHKLEAFFINSIFKYKNSFIDGPDADNSNLFTVDNDLRFMWLYNSIIKNITDENTLFSLFKDAVRNSDNLSSLAEFMISFGLPHGFFPDSKDQVKVIITQEHYLQLEKIFIRKIKDNFSRIHTYYNPCKLLTFMQIRAKQYYEQAMNHYMAHDEDLVRLLENMYFIRKYDKEGAHKMISTWALNKYISDEKLKKRLGNIKHKKSNLVTRAQRLIKDIDKAKESDV